MVLPTCAVEVLSDAAVDADADEIRLLEEKLDRAVENDEGGLEPVDVDTTEAEAEAEADADVELGPAPALALVMVMFFT